MGKERQRGEQIKHRFHKHPLVFVDEEQTSQSQKTYCSGCREVVLGPRFGCVECKYLLHQKCAGAPYEIQHPLHGKHSSGLFLREGPESDQEGYACALCMEKRNMFFYECHSCWFALDINCALSSYNLGENFPEFEYDVHQHPLTFIENHKDELKRFYCSLCHQPLLDAVYVCLSCQFRLHKKCLDELPTKINHPSHHIHPLFLKFTNDDPFCKLCQKEHRGSFYSCSSCNFSINFECAWKRPITVQDKSHHEHPFTLFWRRASFICDACGIDEGNYISYICSTCQIMVHEKCVSLPRIIKTTRHHHYIIHNYFFQKKEVEKHDCGICLKEVNIKYGSYNCSKEDCSFVAHVNCAMEMYVEDDEDEETVENLESNSSITHVFERSEHGEATKIKHFSHEHDLTLDNKIKEDDDKHCDGCMLRISTLFYHCSQCEFLLHKTCAELPRKKYHWFHQSLTTLHSQDFFKCNQCDRLCSGFVYKSDEMLDTDFCSRCARISHTPICEGHNHTLFFDFKFKGQCSACGVTCGNGAFKCKDCTSFALDFACITLPQATRHKCDEHFLKLTFHEESDDPEQHYCDVCEKKRDPTHWFYHCAICDNSAHPKCALEKYPFLKAKIEMEFPYRHHPHRHDLFFAKKDIFDSCSSCGKPFQGVALKCEYCGPNYFIHYDCWPPCFCRDG